MHEKEFQKLIFIVILWTLVQNQFSENHFTNYIDVLKASREGMKTTLKHYYRVFETK